MGGWDLRVSCGDCVSMKSGLEGRNNQTIETDFGKCNIMLSQ